jgi:hypothetical protein
MYKEIEVKNIIISVFLTVFLAGCGAPMTAGEYCAVNGFKPGTKNYLSCLQMQQQAAIAQQQYYNTHPSSIQESTNRMTQIWNSQQPKSTCVTREEFGRLVTECK